MHINMGLRRETDCTTYRYVETKILTDEDIQSVKATGAEFALASDAAEAVMRFLCDKKITGSCCIAEIGVSCIANIPMKVELSPLCREAGSRADTLTLTMMITLLKSIGSDRSLSE